MYQQRGNILASIPQVTKVLLGINIVVFLLEMISGGMVNRYLALFTINTGLFKPYQIITHMFAHANFSHLFMNMFGLYMFGRTLEQVLGGKKFFALYFISGLGAAGLQFLIYNLQATPAAMVGASGAIFGILAAFAVMFPNVELMLIFFPVPIKAKYFVLIYGVIELFFGVANFSMDNIAHFAHLGGAIAGFLLTMYWKKNQFNQHLY
jgi:membrane associated rhomboid family serine protease